MDLYCFEISNVIKMSNIRSIQHIKTLLTVTLLTWLKMFVKKKDFHGPNIASEVKGVRTTVL